MSSRKPPESTDIRVSPKNLFLMDIETNLSNNWFFRFKPLDYDLVITFSGFVITRLLRWAISTGFIVIDGSYTIQEGRKRRRYDAKESKSSIEKENGASLATPSKDS